MRIIQKVELLSKRVSMVESILQRLTETELKLNQYLSKSDESSSIMTSQEFKYFLTILEEIDGLIYQAEAELEFVEERIDSLEALAE
ncbi:MAG: hypothetical protein BAJATHORv1_10126 [Candidatus Thorarchaeota archaeon]|nr:MAG: hypothetical protein BAJATHORv1_10126 [Candidatus Thorarchaeota archaeon]